MSLPWWCADLCAGDWNLQDWKMTDNKNPWEDIAGLEIENLSPEISTLAMLSPLCLGEDVLLISI